jgi:hypothetical protein
MTRCAVVIKCKDGSYVTTFCEHDGYILDSGYVLYNYYNDVKKLKSLITGGDICVIRNELPPSYIARGDMLLELECSRNDWTTYLRSDRLLPRTFSSCEDMVNYYANCACKYIYQFDESKAEWYYMNVCLMADGWKLLSDAINFAVTSGCDDYND